MTDFPKLNRLKSDDESMEKIHVAARKGQTDEVRRLIDTGVSPTIQNRFGCTALHLACKFGCVETAKYLARAAEVHSSWHGQKPVHLAVMANKLDLVEALVEGAKERGQLPEILLNECDEREVHEIGSHVKHCRGQTALHWCVGLGKEYLPMIKLLVQLGASPTAKDKADETPLMRAMEFCNREALDAMLENIPNKNSLRLDYADKKGYSHLHWAIVSNSEDVALNFLKLGIDVNMEDNEHVVPLYLAVRAAMVSLTKELVEKSDVFLIQNCPYHNGTTVLPDRIAWMDFVPADADTAKQEVVHLLQEKLIEVTRNLNVGAGAPVKKKKASTTRPKKVSWRRMEFNPINIEEEGYSPRQNGVATAVAITRGAGHRDATGLLSQHASFGDALRACRNAFYYHTSWSVPYPEVPATPMLYYLDEYKHMIESTMPVGIMQSELDAMKVGLLESIPLAYYPLEPNALDDATSSSSMSAAHASDRARSPRNRLDAGDAEIARIVVDSNEIQIRNLPSLTHVQRPLYTDIGLVPQEERHAARVARAQPMAGSKPSDAALTTAEMVRQWRLDVQASFVQASQIDSGFARFIEEIAHAKLGLDRNSVSHLRLTRALWSLLYQGTTKRQQRKVWYTICHFSSTYSDIPSTSEAAVSQLLRDTEALGLPQYLTNWRPLLTEYTQTVGEYVAALAGGVEQRRENLQFHDKELDQLYTGNVCTNIELDGKLARTSADRAKNTIYPVEVVPVYPSEYHQAVSLGATVTRLRDTEDLDFLAERDASLHHVILPDAVLPKVAAGRPNMLVGGCNLLVTDEGDFSNVQVGATLRYSVSAENTYQTLRQDPMSTASYLLRMGQVATDAAASLGANHDGRFVVYDRVGHRDVYQKTNSMDTNTLSRYVVMFTDAGAATGVSEATADAGSGTRVNCVKREREQASLREEAVDPSEHPAQLPRTE